VRVINLNLLSTVITSLTHPPQKLVLYQFTPYVMKARCAGCQYDTERRRERRMQRMAKGKKAVKKTFDEGKAGFESGEDDDMAYIWATALSRVFKTARQWPTLSEMNVDEGFIISLAQNAGNGLTPNLNHRGNVAASKTQVSICQNFFYS
jgi:hypothetical protein